jgi:amino acid transporter
MEGPAVASGGKSRQSPFYVGSFQLFAVTLLGSIPGVYSVWSSALPWGLGYILIFSVISSITFFMYCSCMSELTSTFPFPGGTYALARVTVGFYPGFMVGCAEILYYILVVAIYNFAIVAVINLTWPQTLPYQGELVALFYLTQLCLCLSRRVFWVVITLVGLGALAINLTYLFGAIKYFDFQKWAYSHPNFDYTHKKTLYVGDYLEAVETLPFSMQMFMGLEIVNLMCDEVREPRKQIPIGQLSGAFIICCLNVVIPLVTASMYPGTDILVYVIGNPLVIGLMAIFKLTVFHAIGLQMIGWFGWATYATYGLSKLIAAMAASGLLPSVLATRSCRFLCCWSSEVYAEVPTSTNVKVAPGNSSATSGTSAPSTNTADAGDRTIRPAPVTYFSRCLYRNLSKVRAAELGEGVCSITGCGTGVLLYATLFGSALSSIAYVVYVKCYNNRMAYTATSVFCVCALLTYTVQLIGFITLRFKLSQFPRAFNSPFGITGAVLSLLWFLLGLVVVLFIRPEAKYTASSMAVWFVVCSGYYYFVGRHNQMFSETEKAVLLPAHAEVRNANGKFNYNFVGEC